MLLMPRVYAHSQVKQRRNRGWIFQKMKYISLWNQDKLLLYIVIMVFVGHNWYQKHSLFNTNPLFTISNQCPWKLTKHFKCYVFFFFFFFFFVKVTLLTILTHFLSNVFVTQENVSLNESYVWTLSTVIPRKEFLFWA